MSLKSFYFKLKVLTIYLSVHAQLCLTLLRPHGLQASRLLCPWKSPGKNTEVGCHCLIQGMFPTQGLNSGLLHCRQTLYQLSQTHVKEMN